MSERLDELTHELERLATRLRSDGLDAAAAAELVEECAQLATEAAAELDRESRAVAAEPPPGQTELL